MRTSNLFGVLAIGALTLSFCQCKENSPVQPVSMNQGVVTGMKIAYVEIDTLLSKYQFYLDLAEDLLRKEENSRLLLSEKANEFQKEVDDYNNKLQHNVFSSQERAQQEANRIGKKQQDVEELNERLSRELAIESQNNSLMISDSIQAYLKDYNKSHGFSIILSKVGDNILLIDPAMNITNEIIEGLNARYNSAK